ncbi:MAG: polysaccharide biosynthesis protein [Lachnospiraceae bacterium]|nr:polysaccharide biosynthesis protein [Lachnospiraceae bacterium]
MGRNSKKSSNFIVQGGILAIAGIITRIIGMIYRIPVNNIIGTEGNGYYSAAFQVYSIMLLISSYSLPLAVSKLVSARISKGQYKNAQRIFKGALLFSFVTGGIVCILIFLGSNFFATKIMSEPLSAIALKIFAPTLLIVAIMGVIRGYFQGMGTMVPTAVSQIVEQIVNAVVSILAATYLFHYGKKVADILRNDSYAPAYGAAGSTLGTSVGAFIGLIFLIIVLLLIGKTLHKQSLKDQTGKLESYHLVLKILLLTVVPVIFSTAIYNISDLLDNSIFNKIMIQKGFESTKASIWGTYTGEYKLLLNVPIALANAMSASTVPVLSKYIALGNRKVVKKRISSAMRFTMFIAFPCAVGLGVLALPIMSMLFHEGYDLAAKLMQMGCVNIVLFSISTLSNGILQGINKMKIPVRNAILSLIVHLAILFLFLQYLNWGIYSVVIANIVFSLMMSILNHLAIRKYLHYKQEVIRTFLLPAVSSIIMGITLYGIYYLLHLKLSNIFSTLVSILLGAIVYFITIIKLKGLREEELLTMPCGRSICKIAKTLHLL